MNDHIVDATKMVSDREAFEAWAKQAGWPHGITNADGSGFYRSQSWEGWQASTQHHKSRIAELEAQVKALSVDAGRYQFLRAGGAYLEPNSEEIYMATDDGGKYYHDLRDFDMDIDAAIASGALKEGA